MSGPHDGGGGGGGGDGAHHPVVVAERPREGGGGRPELIGGPELVIGRPYNDARRPWHAQYGTEWFVSGGGWVYFVGLLFFLVVASLLIDPVARALRGVAAAAPPPPPPKPHNVPASQVTAYVAAGGGAPPAAHPASAPSPPPPIHTGTGTVAAPYEPASTVAHTIEVLTGGSGTGTGSGTGGGSRGHKKALLFGLNYVGTENELHGCIDDIDNIRAELTGTCGFPASGITMMTDYTPIQPTRANMLAALTAFAAELVAGDVAVVWYSGHGSSTSYDPLSRHAEQAICPLDFASAGFLDANVIRDTFVKNLAAGVALAFMGFDACHSATICDLHYGTEKDAAVKSIDGGRDVAATAAPPAPAAAPSPKPTPAVSLTPRSDAIVARLHALNKGKRTPPVTPSPPTPSPPAPAPPAPPQLTPHQVIAKRASAPRRNHRDIMAAAHVAIRDTAVAAALAAPLYALVEEASFPALPANVIVVTGCKNEETSADAYEGGEGQGAATWAFITAIKALPPNASMNAVRFYMLALLKASGYTQHPQAEFSNANVGFATPLMQLLSA